MTACREERRLAFVAITRAREECVLSYILRGPRGEAMPPSRFLAEIPNQFLQKEEAL